MQYYVFKATTGTAQAVTDDNTGAKLPKRSLGRWESQPYKKLDLKPGDHLIGASTDDIIAGIAKDGYYSWPQPEGEESK